MPATRPNQHPQKKAFPMSMTTFTKSIQDIMRADAGINGDAQRIEQLTWLLFLKIYGN